MTYRSLGIVCVTLASAVPALGQATACHAFQPPAAAPAANALPHAGTAQSPAVKTPPTAPPPADRQPKSRLVRSLLDLLDPLSDQGTDEERKLVRKTLLDADETLFHATGSEAIHQIERANRKRLPLRVEHVHRKPQVPARAREPK